MLLGFKLNFVKIKVSIMNNQILIPLVFSGILSSTIIAHAQNNTMYVFNVSQNCEPEKVDDDPPKHRSHTRSLICTISSNGVCIPTVLPDDIYLYEVNDSTGRCMASFTSEEDFISFIFSTHGIVEIKFFVDGAIFQGCVSL